MSVDALQPVAAPKPAVRTALLAGVLAGVHGIVSAALLVRATTPAEPLLGAFAAIGAALWAFEAWTAYARAAIARAADLTHPRAAASFEGSAVFVNSAAPDRTAAPEPTAAPERISPVPATSALFAASHAETFARHSRVERLVGQALSAGTAGALGLLALAAYGASPPFGPQLLPDLVAGGSASPLEAAALAIASAFVLFVGSQYVRSLSEAAFDTNVRSPDAAASGADVAALAYPAGFAGATAVLLAALSGGLALESAGYATPLTWLPRAAGALFAFAGVEVLFALVTTGFRPRRGRDRLRPAYASRLLDVLADPGTAARRLDEAIDYQLGFAVSETRGWRRLLAGAPPLVALVAAFVLVATSVVVVEPHQQARLAGPAGAQSARFVGPGFHWGWPWPLGESIVVDTGRIRELAIGSSAGRSPADPSAFDSPALGRPALDSPAAESPALGSAGAAAGSAREPSLWTRPRGLAAEVAFLVAGLPSPSATGYRPPDAPHEPVSVSFAGADLRLQYTVTDLERFLATRNVEAHLQALAQAEVSRTLAGASLDAWLRADRVVLGAALRSRIQVQIDAAKLGVTVSGVAVASIYPPAEVADSFHEVVRSAQERAARITQASQAAESRLGAAVGSIELATRITHEIDRHAALIRDRGGRDRDVVAHAQRVEASLRGASGEAARLLGEARQAAWRRDARERAFALRFTVELAALRRAPSVYRAYLQLDALTDALTAPGIRKIVLATDRERVSVRYDLTSPNRDLLRAFGSAPPDGASADQGASHGGN